MKKRLLIFLTGRHLLILALSLVCCLQTNAQTGSTVSGTVIDAASSEPLAGVSVSVQGRADATQTDGSGHFKINASKGATLIFRYISFSERSVVVGDNTNLVIKMSGSSQGLKEVVVLAYGSQRKADITAAVSQVDLSKSQGIPASNVGRLLQGQAPGVVAKQTSGQPGQELQVEIRGNSSLGANSDPLYVVDGFPVGTNVGNSLNANDIESITILKDAASTSVYGSRGANGVVLITTKSGKKDGSRLTVTTNNGFANVPDSRRIHVLNGQQFTQFQNDVFSDKIRYFQNREPVATEIPADFRNPEQTTTSTDWYKEILHQNAPFSDYNVALTNGSEKSSSYINIGYLKQDGSLINTGFNRVSARANLDGRPNKFLNFGLHLSGAYSWAKNADAIAGGFGNNIVDQALLMDPREPVYNEDGSFNNYVGGHDNIFGFPNPVQRLMEEQHKQYKSNVTANAYVDIKFLKDLNFRTNLNGVVDDMRNHDFTPSGVAGFNSAPPAAGKWRRVLL